MMATGATIWTRSAGTLATFSVRLRDKGFEVEYHGPDEPLPEPESGCLRVTGWRAVWPRFQGRFDRRLKWFIHNVYEPSLDLALRFFLLIQQALDTVVELLRGRLQ